MSFKQLLFSSAAIIASVVAGCIAVSDTLAPNHVNLATGIPGGVYHPVGNAICRMFNLEDEHQAMPCVAASSDGSVENIRRVESGESTLAFCRPTSPMPLSMVRGHSLPPVRIRSYAW